jgi:hypothetical protein
MGGKLATRHAPGQAARPRPCYAGRMLRRTLLTVPAIMLLHPAFGAPAALTVRTQYECLWWSESQMEGLRADSPLPKTTRVKLDRWEYSDPVGVPNPDDVILVVTLSAPAGRTLSLTVRPNWRIGGNWRTGIALPARSIALEPGAARTEEFTIPVRQMIYDLRARRLSAMVMADGKQVARAELPIIGGD